MFRTDDEASNTTDYATGFRLDYPNDLWDAAISWKQIGNDFRPALGYVRRNGIRRATAGVQFGPRPEEEIRQVVTEFRPEVFTDLDNIVQNWSVEFAPANIEFNSGDSVTFTFVPEFERLEEPFEIGSDVVLPRPGSYQWNRFEAGLERLQSDPGSRSSPLDGENTTTAIVGWHRSA